MRQPHLLCTSQARRLWQETHGWAYCMERACLIYRQGSKKIFACRNTVAGCKTERLRPLRVWLTAGSCHKATMAAPGRVAHRAAIMDGYICLSIVIVFERKLVNVKHARCTARKFIAISATGSCHDDIGGYAACRTILKFEFKGLIFGA